MKIKWQWFLGGQNMLWIMLLLLVLIILTIIFTYVVNPTECLTMKVQSVDATSIKELSREYVSSLRN